MGRINRIFGKPTTKEDLDIIEKQRNASPFNAQIHAGAENVTNQHLPQEIKAFSGNTLMPFEKMSPEMQNAAKLKALTSMASYVDQPDGEMGTREDRLRDIMEDPEVTEEEKKELFKHLR